MDGGELGDVRYVYSNRLNLGVLRPDENALWSLGAHDVSVILRLAGEEPYECRAVGESYMQEGIEDVVFCFLRFPSGLAAHMHLSWLDPHKERRFTVVGSKKMATFDDMELERKLTVYDKGFDENWSSYGEYIARSGDTFSPRVPNDEPLRVECAHFVESVRDGAEPRSDGRGRPAGGAGARGAAAVAAGELACRPGLSRPARRWCTPAPCWASGVRLGDGCVVGKPPVLAAGSSAAGEEPGPARLGDGVAIGRGRGGARRGGARRRLRGRRPGPRARADLDRRARRVVGRGASVENDVTDRRARAAADQRLRHRLVGGRGRRVRRARRWCSPTTPRPAGGAPGQQLRGPTLRRACRIGAGAVLLPGVEVGEEAFVAAGRGGHAPTCRRAPW